MTVSSVKARLLLPTLPAVSVSVTSTLCSPLGTTGVKVHWPVAALVGTETAAAPSMLISTAAPGSPMPDSAGLEVIRSVAEIPVSDTSATLTTGATLSTVKVNEAVPVLPATSVSVTTTVCTPSVTTGVRVQLPAASVATETADAPSTLTCTAALGSPVPDTAGLEVIPSAGEIPVSATSPAVTTGAVLSSVKVSVAVVSAGGVVVLNRFVSLTTMVWGPSGSVGVKLQAPPTLAVAI